MNSFHRVSALVISLVCLAMPDQALEAAEASAAADFARGPHNGRLLVDDTFTLELAIFETGVPPEYHVWATEDGNPIAPAALQLDVALTRLGGDVDTFEFAVQDDYLRSLSVVEEPHSFDVAVTATYNGRRHSWTFPSYEGRVTMAAPLATQSGLATAIAGSGTLQQQLKLYGQVMADPERVRELTARFPGVVRSVNASIGTSVSAGDVLATIEGNESLRAYDIASPIDGVVVARTANTGEATTTDALFTIADYGQLLANFSVFPQDAARISVGQTVVVNSDRAEDSSRIAAVIPGAGNAPASTARVPLDNSTGTWTPGTWVNAFVTVAETAVPLLIDNRALQSFRDWQVVFIKIGDNYEIRPLELGRSDGSFTEVLAGLNAGDVYVVENSYLLKADLEKSGASHDH